MLSPLFCTVIVGLLALASSPQDNPSWDPTARFTLEQSHPREFEFTEALREARAQGYDLGEVPEELSRQVGALGQHDSGVFDLALEILRDRRIPATDEAPEQILSLVQEGLCLELFARGPKTRASKAIDSFWAAARKTARATDPNATPSEAEVEAVLLASGALGRAQDMSFILSIAPESPRPGGAFERALTQLLNATPDAYESLRRHWVGLSELQSNACMTALTNTTDSRALYVIEEVLRWNDEAVMQAAGVVQSIGRSMDAKLNASLALYLSEVFEFGSTSAQRASALALAALRDADALPALIAALRASEDAHLTEALLRALRATSGLALPAKASVWELWYTEELAWRASEAPRLVAELRGGKPVLVIDAIRQLVRHPFASRHFVEDLVPLLRHGNPDVVRATCQALVELDMPNAIVPLIEQLERTDVENQVEQALKQLTGWPAQADADAWRAKLALSIMPLD